MEKQEGEQRKSALRPEGPKKDERSSSVQIPVIEVLDEKKDEGQKEKGDEKKGHPQSSHPKGKGKGKWKGRRRKKGKGKGKQ